MKSHHQDVSGIYFIGIFVLFIAGFLLLVLYGARVYQQTVKVQRANNEYRAELSYLATMVRNSDETGAVEISEGPEGDALVFVDREGDNAYATSVYCYQGSLMEEYGIYGATLDPDNADAIASSSTFEVERISDQLLKVTTSSGNTLLHLRSEGGAAE